MGPPVLAPLVGVVGRHSHCGHRRRSPQPSEGCPVQLWLDHRLVGFCMEAQAQAEGPAGLRWPHAPCGQAQAFCMPGLDSGPTWALTSWHHPLAALARLLTAGVSGGAQYLGLQVGSPLWASVPPNPQPAPHPTPWTQMAWWVGWGEVTGISTCVPFEPGCGSPGPVSTGIWVTGQEMGGGGEWEPQCHLGTGVFFWGLFPAGMLLCTREFGVCSGRSCEEGGQALVSVPAGRAAGVSVLLSSVHAPLKAICPPGRWPAGIRVF